MRSGYWMNYRSGVTVVEVYRHESDIRDRKTARKLAVPESVFKRFSSFRPDTERVRFLTFLMRRLPLMRVRGYGGLYTSFEHASRSDKQPWAAIHRFVRQMPDDKLLNIVCLRGHMRSVQLTVKDFRRLIRKRYGARAVSLRPPTCRISKGDSCRAARLRSSSTRRETR